MSIGSVENIPQRLRDELTRLGLSQAEASRRSGESSPQRLKDVLAGRQRCPADLVARLATIGVDYSYVLTGEALGAPDAQPLGLPVADTGPDLVPVSMYDIEAAAGAGRSFEGEPIKTTLQFPRSELTAQGLDPAQIVGVQVRGDSMDGTLADGDWVLVNRANRDPKQEGVFLLLLSGERRIKRVQRLAGGALYLISDNELYQPEMIKPQDMGDLEILGRCEIRIGRVV